MKHLQYCSNCIDFIFVNQPKVVVNPGIHPSLHLNCHHQVIFCKLHLKIKYPPPYTREVCDYGQARKDFINGVINQFDWVNLYLDKNINKQVILFNRTILNMFHTSSQTK